MAERTADREEVDLNEGFIDKEHEPTCHGPIVKWCIRWSWRAGKSSHNSCNCVIVVNSTIFWGKRRWNRWFLDYSVILSNHDGKLEKWEFLHHLIKWRWKLCECIIKYVFGRRLHFSRLTSKNLLIKKSGT